MSLQLVVVDGPDKGRKFLLKPGTTLVVGRGDASDTRLNDSAMSRVHFALAAADTSAIVTDKGSSSGTIVGDKLIDGATPVSVGGLIKAGNTVLQLTSDLVANQKTVAPRSSTKATDVSPLQDLVGAHLGPYEITSIITKGNSGMVFKGHDAEKNRIVAIKVLSPEFTSDDEQRERFVRAMKTMLPIKDPHIVRLYHAGKNGPYCWAAMEYVEGESLTQLIDRVGIEGMLDWKEVWRIAMHIGRALRVGFENKIIHRNVTPQNILRRHSDRAALLGDLMLAKAMEGTNAKQITQPGQLLGDLPYMAPERTKDGAAVDTRSDIYGLGATCYALLTGRPPAVGETIADLVKSVREGSPPPPKRIQLAVNDLFQAAVMKMIEKDPEKRFQSPAELLTELTRIGKYNNLEADWSNWAG